PKKLRVFPEDADIPADQLNTTIDEHFVPVARVTPPTAERFGEWKDGLAAELRRVVFHSLPDRIRAAQVKSRDSSTVTMLKTEPGIWSRLEQIALPAGDVAPKRIVLFVQTAGKETPVPDWFEKALGKESTAYRSEPRGVGETRWTIKSPPNYV